MTLRISTAFYYSTLDIQYIEWTNALMLIQWNLSNVDTIGPSARSIGPLGQMQFREVSLIQGVPLERFHCIHHDHVSQCDISCIKTYLATPTYVYIDIPSCICKQSFFVCF